MTIIQDTSVDPNAETTIQATEPINPGELLRQLRAVRDERDELSREDSDLSKTEQELKRRLIRFHEQSGLTSLADHGLSVTFDPAAMRVRYTPDKWDEIVRWLVENGYGYAIQRRLSDAKVLELVSNGTVLPEGLTLESYIDISVRRKN